MYPHFDIYTFILYLFMGIIFALLMKQYHIRHNNYTLFIAYFIFIVFAISRTVGMKLGGMDSYTYEYDFIHSLNKDLRYEPLFSFLTISIRYITDEPVIYRFFCYSVILGGYIFFIKHFYPNNASSIPFIAIIIPYLLSFNTMRSSMAASIILFGIVFLKKKKYLMACIICVSAVFIHRMSALYVPFVLFFFILRTRWIYKTKFRLILVITSISLISLIVVTYAKTYILSSGGLDGNDNYYLKRNEQIAIISVISYILPLVLIFIFLLTTSLRKIYVNYPILTAMIIYDILIFPSSVELGIWRANEFFYIARLVMWAILINQFKQKFILPKTVTSMLFTLCFLIWTMNRINSIWEDSGLMPYILNWF